MERTSMNQGAADGSQTDKPLQTSQSSMTDQAGSQATTADRPNKLFIYDNRAPMRFWIDARVPGRATLVEQIEANGGVVDPDAADDTILLCDPEQMPGLGGQAAFSYQLVSAAVDEGEVPDLDSFLIHETESVAVQEPASYDFGSLVSQALSQAGHSSSSLADFSTQPELSQIPAGQRPAERRGSEPARTPRPVPDSMADSMADSIADESSPSARTSPSPAGSSQEPRTERSPVDEDDLSMKTKLELMPRA
ncbi:uncharacterized protein V1510DRAFT_243816 [Dipodascopsis tothii]|uniref:uncharacterized protein n=1 Tax=Dipodascopsis tothii TaxID=44089 RepID=UPI0034CF826A